MRRQRPAEIKVWTPWPHIGRGAGDLCLGRVCVSLYTAQTPNLRAGWRRPQPQLAIMRPMRFRSFHLWVGPLLFIARRWK